MTEEQVKRIARRFFEEQDRLRGGPPRELCADDYEASLASFPRMDFEGHRQFAEGFYGGFPDLKHEIDTVLSEDDCAFVSFRLVGTNTAPFMGNAATGKPIEVDALALLRVRAGKVTELRGQFDQVSVLQQLGAVSG